MKKYKKIYVEITNVCNLSCSFCSKVLKPSRIMTLDEFKQILAKIKTYTDNIYLHVKGEPLLHPNIIEFLQAAEEYDINVNLTTNGVLLPTKVTDFSNCKALRKINISLHSENKIPNYLENIFNSVAKLPKNITIIYRLWTLNDGKLDNKSQEIVNKIVTYYNLSSDVVEKLNSERNIKISSTIYVDKDNEFIWPEVTSNKSCGYCPALKTQIAILCDGTVVPCCLDSNGVIELGNIYQDSLETIRNSERYQKLKQSFRDRKPSEDLCQSCTFKNRNTK